MSRITTTETTDPTSPRLEHRDGVAWVTLAEPGRRNPLGLATLRRLDDVLEDLGAMASVRVIVIGHEGPAFSAGHDLREMSTADRPFLDELFGACVSVMTTVHRVPQPVIACVDGVATAAGCQLVAACDLAVASSRSTFATPGVRIGLFCSTPMVALSRAIGRKRALEMLLTGEPIDAATATDWGLVNRVVEPDDLVATVTALAESIGRSSPHTIALGKAAFYRQVEMTETDAYELTADVMVANAGDEVAAEGIDAFLAKRPPVWPA